MNRIRLKRAKVRACDVLDEHYDDIINAFRTHLLGNTHSGNIVYDDSGAKRRVREAVFMDIDDVLDRVQREDEIYGETDGDQIWINPWCSLNEMVLTLVHEALHDSIEIERSTRRSKHKKLGCESEHSVMKRLEYCM